MNAPHPDEEFRSRRFTAFILLPLGAGAAAFAAGAWHNLSTFPLVILCGFAALLLYGGTTQLVRPPIFVRLGAAGIEFPAWGMRRLAWSDILAIRVGPLESPGGEDGTIVRIRHPLVLRIRGNAPALDRLRFQFLPRLPDGSVEWWAELDACPLTAEQLLERCRPYLTATGSAQIIAEAPAANGAGSASRAPLGGGLIFAGGGLLFVGLGGWLLWSTYQPGHALAAKTAAGTSTGAWLFVALGSVAALIGFAVLRSRFKLRAR